MASIVDFIYTLDKILIKLTHCSLELIKEKLNGVSWFSDIGADSINLVIYWIYYTHTYKAYLYRAMIMENASLERIPLHIFFSEKGFGKSRYDNFGFVFLYCTIPNYFTVPHFSCSEHQIIWNLYDFNFW